MRSSLVKSNSSSSSSVLVLVVGGSGDRRRRTTHDHHHSHPPYYDPNHTHIPDPEDVVVESCDSWSSSSTTSQDLGRGGKQQEQEQNQDKTEQEGEGDEQGEEKEEDKDGTEGVVDDYDFTSKLFAETATNAAGSGASGTTIHQDNNEYDGEADETNNKAKTSSRPQRKKKKKRKNALTAVGNADYEPVHRFTSDDDDENDADDADDDDDNNAHNNNNNNHHHIMVRMSNGIEQQTLSQTGVINSATTTIPGGGTGAATVPTHVSYVSTEENGVNNSNNNTKQHRAGGSSSGNNKGHRRTHSSRSSQGSIYRRMDSDDHDHDNIVTTTTKSEEEEENHTKTKTMTMTTSKGKKKENSSGRRIFHHKRTITPVHYNKNSNNNDESMKKKIPPDYPHPNDHCYNQHFYDSNNNEQQKQYKRQQYEQRRSGGGVGGKSVKIAIPKNENVNAIYPQKPTTHQNNQNNQNQQQLIEYDLRINAIQRAIMKQELLSVKNRMRLKQLSMFWSVKLMQFLCVCYIMVLTFAPAPLGLVDVDSGYIIHDVTNPENTKNGFLVDGAGNYRAVVATTKLQMICLAFSRASAFSLYPVLISVFLSKCKALKSFFDRTPFSMYMIQDAHRLHVFAGKYIAFDVWIHTVFHLLRWGLQGNLHLLWKTTTGLSGLLVVICTPLITFPMMYFRDCISYEIRKLLHYSFYIFAIGMCFHVPTSAIPNGGFIAPILGFCICLYVSDALYVALFMTEKIETTTFQVLPGGVQMSMDVSGNFQRRGTQGGFVYVCLPWVNQNQWHAFSLFENPSIPNRREVFMLNTGNWTNQVHKALQRNTVRPVWVQGPFESPYNNAESYDNQILVATGIGITPALSVIRAHKDSGRRINLIWSVRDPTMVEFFLDHLYLDHDGWNLIFYTGKGALNPAIEELNTNVCVIRERPNLHVVIPNIIYGIESKRGLPEKYIPSEMSKVKRLLIRRTRELDELGDAMSTRDKLKVLTNLARNNGFLFTELLNRLEEEGAEGGWESSIYGMNNNNDWKSQRRLHNNNKNAAASSLSSRAFSHSMKKSSSFRFGSSSSSSNRGAASSNSMMMTSRKNVRWEEEEGDNNNHSNKEMIRSRKKNKNKSWNERDIIAMTNTTTSSCNSSNRRRSNTNNNAWNSSNDDKNNKGENGNVLNCTITKTFSTESEKSSSYAGSNHGSNSGGNAGNNDLHHHPGLLAAPSQSSSWGDEEGEDYENEAITLDGSEVLQRIRNIGDEEDRFFSMAATAEDSTRSLFGDDDDDDMHDVEEGIGRNSSNNHNNSSQHQSTTSPPPPRSLHAALRYKMSTVLTCAFKPWEEEQNSAGIAKEYVKGLDDQSVLATWGILYCGGNNPVKKALKHISEEYHIALNCESFDW